MVEIQCDEYGQGVEGKMHAVPFAGENRCVTQRLHHRG
jgi:hypothetical protein